MNNFFWPNLSVNDDSIEIKGAEAKHIASARRLKPNDPITLFDGNGLVSNGMIVKLSSSSVTVKITDTKQFNKPMPRIVLASALPKAGRINTLLDMSTQLGMTDFIPLECERSIVKSFSNKKQRLFNICVSACKQSQQIFVPEIHDSYSINDILKEYDSDKSLLLFADPQGDSIDDNVTEIACHNIVLMVGPEGGFSKQELELLISRNVKPVKLASAILRIETACCALLSQISHRQINQNGL